MADTMTAISLSLGDELLDAITDAGRTKAVPVTFEDESNARSINVPVDAWPDDDDDEEDDRAPADL